MQQASSLIDLTAVTRDDLMSSQHIMSPLRVSDACTANFARSGILSPTYRGDAKAMLSPIMCVLNTYCNVM